MSKLWSPFSSQIFWTQEYWTTPCDASITTFQDIFTTTLLVESRVSSNSTTRTLDCLSTLRHLLSWTPQWWRPVSQHFSQQTYGLFLFLFRGQPNNLQLPGHKIIWSTVLPSTTQNLWYPTCLLDLRCSEELLRRKSILLWIHFILLSEFILRTISRPSFHSQPKPTAKD